MPYQTNLVEPDLPGPKRKRKKWKIALLVIVGVPVLVFSALVFWVWRGINTPVEYTYEALLESPSKFENKTVRVSGEVTDTKWEGKHLKIVLKDEYQSNIWLVLLVDPDKPAYIGDRITVDGIFIKLISDDFRTLPYIQVGFP